MENLIKIKKIYNRYMSSLLFIFIVSIIPTCLGIYLFFTNNEMDTPLKIMLSFVVAGIYNFIFFGVLFINFNIGSNEHILFNRNRLKTKYDNYYYVCDNDNNIIFYKKTVLGYVQYMIRYIYAYDSISLKKNIDEFYNKLEKDNLLIEQKIKNAKAKKLAIEEMKNYVK